MKRCKKLLTQFQRLAGAQDGGDPEEQSSEGCKWQQHKRRGDWWSSQFSHALIIYLIIYYSQDCSAAESTKDAPKDRTTLVVFIGLLIDLLGEKKLSKWPQCTIFFSFQLSPWFCLSFLLWLATTEKMIPVDCSHIWRPRCFFNSRLACKDVTRLTVSAAWWEPRHNSTPCCLVDSSAVSSLFFR